MNTMQEDGDHGLFRQNEGSGRAASVPYFSQWESAHLAGAFIRRELDLKHDPAWAGSGAADIDEYAHWANHVCGMACLKMVLAARTGRIHPTLELTRRSLPYGAYTVDGNDIKGMIYAPFVRYVEESFGLRARVHVGLESNALPALMDEAEFFMASVHPDIHWPDRVPPKKGGHLVLVTRASADEVVFHNPSGMPGSDKEPGTQADARVPLAVFGTFFAGRGVAILPT